MKINPLIQAILMSALLSSGIRQAAAEDLGLFDAHADIGAPKLAGSAAYDAKSGEYTLTGAGTNMWLTGDQFQFLYKQMKGDFILRARVEFVGKGKNPHRKVGWMVRSGLAADAPYVDCARHGVDLTSIQYRLTKGAITAQKELPIKNPEVIEFERRGSNYIFSAAHNGETYVSTNFSDIALPDEVYVGLFICSHEGDTVEKAIFRDVQVIRPMRPDFRAYTDFIGSELHILDVPSGKLETIYRSVVPFEAPNWTRDGKALIYNVSGRAPGWGGLMRFDLKTRKPELINTGTNNKNNNDHVLSFDGKLLGISDTSAPGGSSVYVVPVKGGTPTRVTRLSPSYLHGWSPDAKFLVFAGQRSGKFDIYKISVKGGDEIKLTDSPGVNDGPEYTPDGKYIYFNSSRTGKMQLWRMKPDGKEQEQVTDDEFNNWFPHISPDGKMIVFISFPADIPPTDHPYYKRCYLRLMPLAGGTPKVMAYLYGGQGTMNVPSWSPDGKKIAFVSNNDLP
jgi:regulation of enolase protein 1 (concanavalin A-like superfamily)